VGTSFSLVENVRPGSGAHQVSYLMDTGVKHSGREVYRSSPPSAEIRNEWSCIYTSPYDFMAWTGTFLIFHMHAICHAHHVIIRLLCSVKLPSFKVLPAAKSRLHTFSRHTTLLSSPHILLALHTMLHCLL